MKLLLLIAFPFLCTQQCFSQMARDNPDSIIKKSNVIKETWVSFRYKDKVLQDSFPLAFEILYNTEGKTTELNRIFKGNATTIESFYYDDKNKLMKYEFYGAPNKIINTEIYEYDSLGNQTGSHSFGFKGIEPPDDTIKTQGLTRRIYNGKNQLIEIFYTLEADKILHKSQQFSYNNAGRIDKSFYFTPDGELNMSYNYVYEKNGNVTIFARYKQNGFAKAYEWFYNKYKQLIKKIDHYGKGHTTNYYYNPDGTLLEKREIGEDQWITLEKHSYIKK